MADNVENVTLEILKSIQASIARLDAKVADLEARLSDRFDRLDAAMRKDRRNVAGMLVRMRSVAGDFDERVNELEGRATALEEAAH